MQPLKGGNPVQSYQQMNLEDSMISKRSQLQKDKCCTIPLIRSI